MNPSVTEFYFLPELSFYSVYHGGTFHFFQLNVLYADQFIKSLEFQHLVDFLRFSYSDPAIVHQTQAKLDSFFHSLEHKRDII